MAAGVEDRVDRRWKSELGRFVGSVVIDRLRAIVAREQRHDIATPSWSVLTRPSQAIEGSLDAGTKARPFGRIEIEVTAEVEQGDLADPLAGAFGGDEAERERSEERRVGKEC